MYILWFWDFWISIFIYITRVPLLHVYLSYCIAISRATPHVTFHTMRATWFNQALWSRGAARMALRRAESALRCASCWTGGARWRITALPYWECQLRLPSFVFVYVKDQAITRGQLALRWRPNKPTRVIYINIKIQNSQNYKTKYVILIMRFTYIIK